MPATPDSPAPIILCGLDRIGIQIITLLRRLEEPVTVITDEKRPDWHEYAKSIGCLVLVGDARSESLLLKAGVRNARAIISAMDDDLSNVTVALDAKKFNSDIAIVIRLFDQKLAAQFESALSIRRALSTSAIAAPTYAAAALGDRILAAVPFHGALQVIEEVTVESGSPWSGKTIRDTAAETGMRIIAHCRGEKILEDALDDGVLESGDELLIMTTSRERERSLSRFSDRLAVHAWQRGVTADEKHAPFIKELVKHISRPLGIILAMLSCVIVLSVSVFHFGLGMDPLDAYYFVITTVTTVGYGDFNLMNAAPPYKIFGTVLMLCGAALTAALFGAVTDFLIATRFRALLASRRITDRHHIIVTGSDHASVRIIEELAATNKKTALIAEENSGGEIETLREMTPLIIGNPRNEETLLRAGIRSARALIAATDNDLDNLSSAMLAKKLNPDCRTVVRVFHSDLSAHLPSLGVDSVLSTSLLAAPVFVGAALYDRVAGGFTWRDRLAVVMPDDSDVRIAWRKLSPLT